MTTMGYSDLGKRARDVLETCINKGKTLIAGKRCILICSNPVTRTLIMGRISETNRRVSCNTYLGTGPSNS